MSPPPSIKIVGNVIILLVSVFTKICIPPQRQRVRWGVLLDVIRKGVNRSRAANCQQGIPFLSWIEDLHPTAKAEDEMES